MSNITSSEIHRIINRSVMRYFNDDDNKLNTEMLAFEKRYYHYLSHTQRSLFDEPVPTQKELSYAINFCNTLERYRISNDINAKENFELSHTEYLTLLKGIQYYRKYIPFENVNIFDSMERNIKYFLPEYRLYNIIEDYNNDISIIKSQHKIYQKKKKTSQSATSTSYQILTVHFFKELSQNQELKDMPACPEKIELYKNCISIVDYLPKDKYNRTTKYKIKCQFYLALFHMAKSLPTPDIDLARKSHDEYQRFTRAIERSLTYAKNPNVISALRNKRTQDEWLYR